MAKLILYIQDKRLSKPTALSLNTASTPENGMWLVGRPSNGNEIDIVLNDRSISREHAWIRCEQAHGREQWQIKHIGRNATKQNGVALDYDHWSNIKDYDAFEFGFYGTGFIAERSQEETIEVDRSEIEAAVADSTISFSEEDVEAAEQRMKAAEADHSKHWGDTIQFVLTGPQSWQNWVWWCFLVAVAATVVVLIYG